MSFRRFLLLIFYGYLMLSCTDDVVFKESEIDSEEEQLTSVMLMVRVDESIYTRSGNNETDRYFPETTIAEKSKRFYNVLVAVFNKNKVLEYYKVDDYWPMGIDNSANLQGCDYAFALVQKLSTGPHYFYVMANVPKTLIDQKDRFKPGAMTLNEFESEILSVPDIGYVINNHSNSRGFMMTNPEAAKADTLSKTVGYQAPPPENYIYIKLVKIASKVSVAYIPEENGEVNGSLENIEYLVANNPNRMYIIPKPFDQTFLTPHYYLNTYNPVYYLSEPAHSFQPATTKDFPSESNPGEMSYTYCTENNNLYPLQGNTTMLLIRAQFIPKELKDCESEDLLNPDPVPKESVTNSTFWRIGKTNDKGKIVEYLPYYFNGRPNTENLGNEYKEVQYVNGITYYPFWLKHPDYGYAVKRNSYCKILISGVTDAGSPDEGNVIDTEKPLEETPDTQLKINIIDWENSIQEEVLGEDNIPE